MTLPKSAFPFSLHFVATTDAVPSVPIRPGRSTQVREGPSWAESHDDRPTVEPVRHWNERERVIALRRNCAGGRAALCDSLHGQGFGCGWANLHPSFHEPGQGCR